EHFAPRELWSNGLGARAPGFVRLERALDAAGTRRVALRRGMRVLARDGVCVDVLHPTTPREDELNDGSLVLRIAYGGASVLFTGDIEAPAERELVRADAESRRDGGSVRVASSTLKVAHHG